MNYYLGKAIGIWAVLKVAFLPFIGFDLIKAGVASVIAVPVAKQVRLMRPTG
jgi:biotin transport system substrate-specific component